MRADDRERGSAPFVGLRDIAMGQRRADQAAIDAQRIAAIAAVAITAQRLFEPPRRFIRIAAVQFQLAHAF